MDSASTIQAERGVTRVDSQNYDAIFIEVIGNSFRFD